MSEFDQLRGDAEKEVQEHPQQVKEGEQAAEKEGKDFAEKEFGGQHGDDSAGGGRQGQGGQGQGQGQGGQGQDQSGQGQ